jgi:Ca2+:H+ antiporter
VKRTTPPGDGNIIAPVSVDPLVGVLRDNSRDDLLVISRGTAVLLLVVYIGYLIFQLKTHAEIFAEIPRRGHLEESVQEPQVVEPEGEDDPKMNIVAAVLVYVRTIDSVPFLLHS